MDYTISSRQVTFVAGDMVGKERCITITVVDDNVGENNEEFTVEVTSPSITGSRSVSVTIEDNDGMSFI